MVIPTTAGWTCAQCGVFVGVNQSHTCRTIPETTGPVIVYSTRPTRYRVHGQITPADRAGKAYDVDLVVEMLP
jgi:hypothetical protein